MRATIPICRKSEDNTTNQFPNCRKLSNKSVSGSWGLSPKASLIEYSSKETAFTPVMFCQGAHDVILSTSRNFILDTSVDVDGLGVNVARALACQKRHQFGYLLGLARPSDRAVLEIVHSLLFRDVTAHPAVKEPWNYGINAYVV